MLSMVSAVREGKTRTHTHTHQLFQSVILYLLYRSNLMGTKFTVYDSGLNPMKSTTSLEASNLRQELAAICYVSSAKIVLNCIFSPKLVWSDVIFLITLLT